LIDIDEKDLNAYTFIYIFLTTIKILNSLKTAFTSQLLKCIAFTSGSAPAFLQAMALIVTQPIGSFNANRAANNPQANGLNPNGLSLNIIRHNHVPFKVSLWYNPLLTLTPQEFILQPLPGQQYTNPHFYQHKTSKAGSN
jgi:hypothetical protein